jgi:hypothetical protein
MYELKNLQGLRFVLLLALLPCMLFSVFTVFTQNDNTIDYSTSPVSEPGTAGSSGKELLVSDYYVLYSQSVTQGGIQLNKIWRQCFSFVVIALFLRANYKITNQKRFIYNYYQKLFHILIISLFLGGRPPPLSS